MNAAQSLRRPALLIASALDPDNKSKIILLLPVATGAAHAFVRAGRTVAASLVHAFVGTGCSRAADLHLH
jgi:hypothetical protein